MPKSLNILIGAGFSYYAGLPLGNDIKAKFDQPFRDRIFNASSSEWFWVEGQSEAMIHNGRLNPDHLEYAFIMEEIVKAYKAANDNQFTDYEDFYQYVKDNTGVAGWHEQIIANAKRRFYSETNLRDENSEYYGHAFRNPERYRPQEIINYLIADLLQINKTEEEFVTSYKPFIQFIKKYESVNIFSLNHDRVLECLFRILGINYCDGFSAEGSILKYETKFLPTFQNKFETAGIRLIKLHGSIDTYIFEHGVEDSATLTRNGQYSYFKPGGYQEKHHPVMVDTESGQIVQHMNFDIIPKFITGKNKKAFIEADYMYSKMYALYKQKISSGDDLLIIGYSFRDEHVNEELKKFTADNGPKVTNLNYGDIFPFVSSSVTEVKAFSELV